MQALELTEQLGLYFHMWRRSSIFKQRLDPSDLRKALSHSITEALFLEAPQLFSFLLILIDILLK